MSVVTGILICHSCSEDFQERGDGGENYKVIDEINAWLAEHCKAPLRRLDEHMCTGKHPQMIVWGGGYNYLGNEEFIGFFGSRIWEDAQNVFLILNPEEGAIEVIRP